MAFPQAVAKNPQAGLAALSGFIFMFFSNRLIKHRTRQPELAFGITAMEGIGIHSFIEGIIYSVTFRASTLIGILAGVGLVAHEMAEGIIQIPVKTRMHVRNLHEAVLELIVVKVPAPLV